MKYEIKNVFYYPNIEKTLKIITIKNSKKITFFEKLCIIMI